MKTKKRRGPALFELIGEDGGAASRLLRFPRRDFGERSARNPSSTDWPKHNDSPGGIKISHQESIAENAKSLGAVSLEGRVLRISLTSVGAAVTVFCVAAALTTVYFIGFSRGNKSGLAKGYQAAVAPAAVSANDELAAARNQPAATHLVANLLERPPAIGGRQSADRKAEPAAAESVKSAAPSSGLDWRRDFTYIVAQEFPAGHVDSARKAQDFLAEKGVSTAVVTPSGGSGILLLTTDGFDHKDAGQKQHNELLLAKVRGIGAQYYTAGGGYRLEGYFKTLKKDNW